MTTNDRCPVCDRPQATAEQWETMRGGEGEHLCWGDHQCTMARVDWRARAEAAETERDEARRLLAAAARGELPRCDQDDDCARLATVGLTLAGGAASLHACDKHAAECADYWRLHGAVPHDLPHAAALRAAIGGAS